MICKNCKSLLPNNINYCNGCGAKVIRNRLTLKNLFQDFAYRYFNYDNQFLRTFTHLFSKPEAVIGSYVDGTRKKYVNVINYFAIALTLSGFQIYFQSKFFPELMDMSAFTQNGSEEFMKNYMSSMQEFQSLIFMAIVPLYALISKLVFYNYKKYNYTEHLVTNMYLAAHFSIISSITTIIATLCGISFSTIGMVILPLQILFSAYCFKRIFGLSTTSIILKTLLFLLILIVLGILFTILSVLIMFLTGGMDQMIEAEKAKRALKN